MTIDSFKDILLEFSDLVTDMAIATAFRPNGTKYFLIGVGGLCSID